MATGKSFNAGESLATDITGQQVADLLTSLTGTQLQKLPHAALYSARSKVPKEQQNLIAPAEHRAFAREAVTENPLMAVSLAAGIPTYQLYKMLMGARSGPSMDQVTQGFAGIGDGLSQTLQDLFK